MGWATNGLSAMFSKFNGIRGGGIAVPTMPKISIGENFYPQVLLTVEAIEKLDISFRDFTEPLKASLNEVIIPSIATNFAVEGRPPWQQLAEYTIEIRGVAHPILNESGNLLSAATNAENWMVTRDDVSMVGIDNEVPYAKYHQNGTINMPAREFINYQPEDLDNIEKLFGKWVDEKIRKDWSKGGIG